MIEINVLLFTTAPHFVEIAFKVVEIAPDELMAIGGGAVLCVCNEHPAIFLKNL